METSLPYLIIFLSIHLIIQLNFLFIHLHCPVYNRLSQERIGRGEPITTQLPCTDFHLLIRNHPKLQYFDYFLFYSHNQYLLHQSPDQCLYPHHLNLHLNHFVISFISIATIIAAKAIIIVIAILVVNYYHCYYYYLMNSYQASSSYLKSICCFNQSNSP